MGATAGGVYTSIWVSWGQLLHSVPGSPARPGTQSYPCPFPDRLRRYPQRSILFPLHHARNEGDSHVILSITLSVPPATSRRTMASSDGRAICCTATNQFSADLSHYQAIFTGKTLSLFP